MNCESRITLGETSAFAAAATDLINDRLARFGQAARAAYWIAVHKAYNTPYNDPAPGKRQQMRRHGAVTTLGVALTSAAEAAIESAAALAQVEAVVDMHTA